MSGTNPDHVSLEQLSELTRVLAADEVCCTRDENTLAELGMLDKQSYLIILNL